MNNYRNSNRPGARTSQTIDPKSVMQDISYSIKTLSPESAPLMAIGEKMGKGPAPKGQKIWVVQEHLFDDIDFCSSVVFCEAQDAGWKRFALITLDQASRPDVNDVVYYSPQDTLYIEATGQNVEVVMTPTGSIRTGLGATDFLAVADSIWGGATGTVTRTPAGTILVRNVEPYAMRTFTTSYTVFMGRTIFESQDIEATPKQRDFIWDCNFVEHKEAVIEMTEDQKNLIQTHFQVPDWNHQQKRMLEEFKREIERKTVFGVREFDATVSARPKHYMGGVLNTLKTNVSFYDPNMAAGTAFETMLQWFMYEQAFRYNPGGSQKIAICGGKFLMKFNQSFAQYRRTTSLKVSGDVGFNIDAYDFMGNTLGMINYQGFRQGTPMENWCLVIDPGLMEWRIKKEFNTKPYDLPTERMSKLMVEWQGTIAFQLEQAHALLRTV
jgi:hypothetical protein